MSMDAHKIDRLERLLNRPLSQEEKDRLQRIKDTLRIADNDALWDIIIAMDYQRNYYDLLPEKISSMTEEILNGLSEAAQKEISIAQSRLAESVVEEARRMSSEHHLKTWLVWGIFLLMAVLIYGSLLLWAGYCIGSGKTHPPALILKMPVGVVLGALCIGCGGFLGVQAAQKFAQGDAGWRKGAAIALGLLLPGAAVFISLAL